jgi:hypothetical protein
MNLCTCNNCGNIWEDMNPDVNAKDYPENLNVKPLLKQTPIDFWCCPECCTDEFLSDSVDETKIEDLLITKEQIKKL